jgi:hypothetical protein
MSKEFNMHAGGRVQGISQAPPRGNLCPAEVAILRLVYSISERYPRVSKHAAEVDITIRYTFMQVNCNLFDGYYPLLDTARYCTQINITITQRPYSLVVCYSGLLDCSESDRDRKHSHLLPYFVGDFDKFQ